MSQTSLFSIPAKEVLDQDTLVVPAAILEAVERALSAAKAEVERLTKELADERSDKDAILNGYQRMARFVKWVRNDSNDEDGELQVMADGVLKRAENKTPYASYWITEMRQRAEAAESALREERERCAKVCEGLKIRNHFASNNFPQAESGFNAGIHEAAKAIRATKGDE